MPAGRRLSPLVLVVLLLCAAVAPPAAAGPDPVEDVPVSVPVPGSGSSADFEAQTAQTGASNTSNTSNTTDRHLGPEFPQTDTEYEPVLTRLETRLGERFRASAAAIEARQFDDAVADLQGNTTVLLDRYDRVAADSPDEFDDRIAEDLNLTARQQRELIESARDARATYSEYQLAQARGNATRARQLARELLTQAEDANQTASELLDRYERLDGATAIDATEMISGIETAQDRLDQLTRNIRENTTVANEQLFVATDLTVDVFTPTASPITPLRVTGRVSANGTRLADRPVELSLGFRSVQTRTDADGRFQASIRPIALAPGSYTARVRYVPASGSKYEATRSDLNVTVVSTLPSVEARVESSVVRFTDVVTVDGQVVANGTTLPGVSVRAELPGQVLGETRTDETGSFRISEPLAATVPSGTRTLSVTVSEPDAAVERTVQTRTVTVASTPTVLSLDATQANDTALRVRGALRTADGTQIPGRPVEVTIGDSDPVRIRPGDAGRFNTTVAVPSGVGGVPLTEARVPVTVSFRAPETNLDPTQRTVTVSYVPPVPRPLRIAGYGTATLAVLLGGALLFRRRGIDRLRSTSASGSDPGGSTPDSGFGADPDAGSRSVAPAMTLLDRADAQYAAGNPAEAVRLGYAALRGAYSRTYGSSSTLTHWEFYDKLEGTVGAAERDTLSRATTAYERAVYTEAQPVPDGDTRTLLASIRDVTADRQEQLQ